MKGLYIKNGQYPRILELNDTYIATGGDNLQGVVTIGKELYFDGNLIGVSNDMIGLHIKNGELYFGDMKISGVINPPIEPDSDLWIPPTQLASVRSPYNYNGLIERYDELMSRHSDYITKNVYSEMGYEDYPLVSYTLTPQNYKKTFYVQAGIHGNEKDGVQTLLRIVEILCDNTDESEYSVFKELKDNVRFVIIPCVHPWGWDNNSMNRPYINQDGEDVDMNMNRNLDMNHQYTLDAAGTGGNYPCQVPETRHIKHILETIGFENIDYAIDYHDGGGVKEHFWINYNMDCPNGTMVRKLVQDLVDYEEKNYPQYKDSEEGWVTFHCADSAGYSTGTLASFCNNSAGILASVCEYLGGYFGYDFTAEQMTRSLRIRGNMLLYAYRLAEKGWTINEEEGSTRFRFDYPRAMTRSGLKRDGTVSTKSNTVVTFEDVYQRWDLLSEKYPEYVKKSSLLGQNSNGEDVYYYTLGNGSKKVLFVGGSMRWNRPHKETEFGAYILAENLCESHIVEQSQLLQTLKNDYTIVVLPCINITAGGNSEGKREIGLNTTSLSNDKWQIVNEICQPTDYALNTAKDIPLLLSFFNANLDAELILSGGEDTTGYASETPKYTTDYMTQFILPKNMEIPSWLYEYSSYLQEGRGEDAPIIEQTDGKTFADYAYDNLQIPTVYLNLQLDNMWNERKQYAQLNEQEDDGSRYFYRTYETSRRLAAIVNIILSH